MKAGCSRRPFLDLRGSGELQPARARPRGRRGVPRRRDRQRLLPQNATGSNGSIAPSYGCCWRAFLGAVTLGREASPRMRLDNGQVHVRHPHRHRVLDRQEPHRLGPLLPARSKRAPRRGFAITPLSSRSSKWTAATTRCRVPRSPASGRNARLTTSSSTSRRFACSPVTKPRPWRCRRISAKHSAHRQEERLLQGHA